MWCYKLILLLIVTSPTLSSVVSDEICPSGPSAGGLSGRFKRQATQLQCVLPSYPEHGSYTADGIDDASPGQVYSSVFLNVTCYPGFIVKSGSDSIYCHNGHWSSAIPKCVRFCRLSKHASVTYFCPTFDFARRSSECGSVVPSGTIVRPVCKTHYYYPDTLYNMVCYGGTWDHVVTCRPDCGKITPEATLLVSGGKSAKRGELPWHAGIYSKSTTPYMQICGGSLVSTTIIISAAHCFWSDINKLLPASEYAVAVGKIYRPWSNPRDVDAQTSDVAEIKITLYFQGAATNFQDDIALVIVVTPFTYQVFVRPVCLDFDEDFDKQQLNDSNMGKVAGWGLVDRNGKFSQVLKVVELPFVGVEKCYNISPHSFREFITSDKICAGYTNGTALCQGDSGGGLAFPAEERGVRRYFLRGVVSTAPKNKDLCSTNALTAFTRIVKHQDFIKTFMRVTSPEPPPVARSDDSRVCPPSQWQCDVNRCIMLDQKCDGSLDCFDGSDEADCSSRTKSKCALPTYPEYGYYTVSGDLRVPPGQADQNEILHITCDPGFVVENEKNSLFCRNGAWSDVMPKCIRACRLHTHDSVEYRCPYVAGSVVKSKKCGPLVPAGTTVEPKCKVPLYHHEGILNPMRCIDGTWDYVAKCKPDCGKVVPEGMPLVSGGKTAYRGELPWHAGIYRKITTPYMQICGGSLISIKTVISVATCFWNETSKIQPAVNYAVAVGKIYRDWSHPDDPDAQKSNVDRILVPQNFTGSSTSYQDDIALVIVATPFTYQVFVRPVCLDFDPALEKQQLRYDNLGKVAGWGFVSEDGERSPELKVSEIPFVDTGFCLVLYSFSFTNLITIDKICAGYNNGTALCRGDRGGGLVFPAREGDARRFILRGLASTAPLYGQKCNTAAVTAFTQVTKHEQFIKDNIITDD